MPAKSAKQYKFMAAKAFGKDNSKSSVGPSKEVAEEFIKNTPKEKRKLFMKKKNK